MLSALQREVFNEPACEHNAHKEKAGCPKPTPGKVGGGCAFDGAFSSLVPIADAAHVVHGPLGCMANAWHNRGSHSSGPSLYRRAFLTNLTNNDVVFGGEKKLYKGIQELVAKHRPPAVFVYQTCVTAMIGDDLQALCKAAEKKTGVPVIAVESPGFIGTKNFGNRLSGEAAFERVIGTMEPAEEHPFNLNVLGEFNIAGEFWEVQDYFERLGIRVICTLSGDARYHEVAMMHKADLSVMVCSKALLNVARKLNEKYEIPWFEGSFYGAANIAETLRRIAEHFGDAGLTARTEELIRTELQGVEPELSEIKERLKGKKALLYTGGVKSWSMVAALQELGMEVIGTSARKSTDQDKERIKKLMGEDAEMIEEGNAKNILKLYHEQGASVLLAGGRNQFTAVKAKIPFVHVNQERETRFEGFQGFLRFARQIDKAIHSPAFAWARKAFEEESPIHKENQ